MDVPGIDLDALLHHYGVCNAGVNLKMKWQADWLLAKGGERKGKGSYSSYSKFVGLTIATLVFTPYSYFKEDYKVTEINLFRRLQYSYV
jgi:hypothetical protein